MRLLSYNNGLYNQFNERFPFKVLILIRRIIKILRNICMFTDLLLFYIKNIIYNKSRLSFRVDGKILLALPWLVYPVPRYNICYVM